jgi:uncharacterized membrane protein YphA (DoxX/SURF4 family)
MATAPQKECKLPLERGCRAAPKSISLHRVQRLFATFPDGQPGAALVLLRLSTAGLLVFHGSACWQGLPALWVTLVCVGIGVFLAIGLFTPFTAIVGAVIGAVALFLGKSCDPVTGGFVLVVLVALGMLGAGAYSLDAHIYGRREVVVPARHE